MDQTSTPKALGPYRILKEIAKGGMGEVYLAFDELTLRKVALKRIRPELHRYERIKKRFLQEATLAAQLNHPSIVPIYSIHNDAEVYYTMPYIEGQTLKDILQQTIKRNKSQKSPHPIGCSIQSLVRIFLNVCQAVSYAHSKKILHRDIKPGNIIVGKFGQVMILDWGLAVITGQKELAEDHEEIMTPTGHHLTKPGKAVGTLHYMAPERVLNRPVTESADIYSLGVLLYQMLTLRLPFKRKSLQEFKRTAKYEKWVDPSELAPERDVPLQLSSICKKCLSFDPKKRFESTTELIHEIESFIEGRPSWILTKQYDVNREEDWEIQESIVRQRHLAISQSDQSIQWYTMMLSSEHYGGNFKIEANVKLYPSSNGIGFLFCVPEIKERKNMTDGFCIWLGSKKNPGFFLQKEGAMLMSYTDAYLPYDKSVSITIEKVEHKIAFYQNSDLIMSYVTHIPVVGTQIGFVYSDPNFSTSNFDVCVGSKSAMVNCLSIPDAFLASRDCYKAYKEYVQIADSFYGRSEGREAIFRSGIALIEEAKKHDDKQTKEHLFAKANQAFERLRATSGAPLEYLGKSILYQLENEQDEELKCYELALRKYKYHPMIHMIEDQVIHRMHQSAKTDRKMTCKLALLVLRLLSHRLQNKESKKLLDQIERHLATLPFFEIPTTFSSDDEERAFLSLKIAFWLRLDHQMIELLDRFKLEGVRKTVYFFNICYALLYNRKQDALKDLCLKYRNVPELEDAKSQYKIDLLLFAISPTIHSTPQQVFSIFEKIVDPICLDEMTIINYLFHEMIIKRPSKVCMQFLDHFRTMNTSMKAQKVYHVVLLKAALVTQQFELAKSTIEQYAVELSYPLSPFYSLYAIYQLCTQREKKVKENYKGVLQLMNPPMTAFFIHYLNGYITSDTQWLKKAFYYEQLQMFFQLELYYTAAKKVRKLKSLRATFASYLDIE